MAAVAQYITIVDKSNKVVGTSRQLKDVFKEAKLAYQERKAEIVAERKRKEDRELRKVIRAMSMAEDESQRSGTSGRRRSHHGTHRRSDHEQRARSNAPPPATDVSSSSSPRSGNSSPQSPQARDSPYGNQMSLGEFNEQLYGPAPGEPGPLIRRRTDLDVAEIPRPPLGERSHTGTDTDVDLDLAYGEFHAPSLMLPHEKKEEEVSSLVLKCKMLLDEANCAQHSAKAIIMHLQKNPDAMAAVALTLAEISNIAAKMAPGALATLGKTAPAVIALLASPEFLVAVGVGVGVTVVALGGYKIIKKIKEKVNADNVKDQGVDEMLEVGELDRIETWRRGIADSQMRDETGSVISAATSVEGEFITPLAAVSMGHLPLPSKDRKKEKADKVKSSKDTSGKRHKKRRGESDTASQTTKESSRRSTSEKSTSHAEKREKALVKVKKPSPLKRMFTAAMDGSSTRS